METCFCLVPKLPYISILDLYLLLQGFSACRLWRDVTLNLLLYFWDVSTFFFQILFKNVQLFLERANRCRHIVLALPLQWSSLRCRPQRQQRPSCAVLEKPLKLRSFLTGAALRTPLPPEEWTAPYPASYPCPLPLRPHIRPLGSRSVELSLFSL